MNKFFIAFPILALLTLGVFIYNSNLKDSSDLKDSSELTYIDWYHCTLQLSKWYCNQVDREDEWGCDQAQSNTNQLIKFGWYPPCAEFLRYVGYGPFPNLLNPDNIYNNCFNSQRVLDAAKFIYDEKERSVYYDEIYAPRYLKCAGLPY